MSTAKKELPLDAVLSATSMQLDIAAEDAESAINRVLDAFEAAAASVEALEQVMEHSGSGPASVDLVASITSLRQLLQGSIVDLQFQDRLMQRLAMASRELRAISSSVNSEDKHLFNDGAVPKSAASLYNPRQLLRINEAAGLPQAPIAAAGEQKDDDDIELF